MCNSIVFECVDKRLHHILTRMGLGQLDKVEHGSDRLIFSNPHHQDVHKSAVVW